MFVYLYIFVSCAVSFSDIVGAASSLITSGRNLSYHSRKHVGKHTKVDAQKYIYIYTNNVYVYL